VEQAFMPALKGRFQTMALATEVSRWHSFVDSIVAPTTVNEYRCSKRRRRDQTLAHL
jgi:hypothetical protein